MTRAPKPARDLRIAIRATATALVGLLALLAFAISTRTERVLVERAGASHLMLARFGAERFREIFSEVEKFSRLTAATLPSLADSPGAQRAMLAEMRQRLLDHGALDVVRTSADGTPAPGSPAELAGLLRSATQACDATVLAEGFCFGGPWQRSPDGDRVIVGSVRVPGTTDRIAVTIDWTKLGEHVAHETSITDGGFGWVLDSGGRLLFNLQHRDLMIDEQLEGASCHECHPDHALARRMAEGGEGTGEIEVRGAERKLVAWVPMEVYGQRWALAVSAPYHHVIASGARSRNVVFVVKGFLAVLVLVLAGLLDRQNRQHIRALSDSEAAVRRLNEGLESEVRRRTAEATSAFAEVSAARARMGVLERLAVVGELAAIVTHEIRTPLNALGLATQRLGRTLRGLAGADKARELAEAQLFEMRRIDGFVSEYLKLARTPRSVKVPTDLAAVVESVARLIEADEGRTRVRVDREIEAALGPIELDADQLRQVLLNLLINAVQAMPGGGVVTIRALRDGDEAVLSVSDTGGGIAPEHRASLFRPFFTTKQNGTGLGLSISARIVEEHHGSIECDSTLGHGTTFRIRLPVVQPAPARAAGGAGGG